MRRNSGSLKARLGIAAGLLGLVALIGAATTIAGMGRVSARIDASLTAERRIERYSVLSTQISSFLVVATEALQSGLSPDERADRLTTLSQNIEATFSRLRRDHEAAVLEAEKLGLNEQSRRATQSIGIARMEALFAATKSALLSDTTDREQLQGHIDSFAVGFDPLLNSVITGEVRTRREIISGIADLRQTLILLALAVAAATLVLLAIFYFGLLRPQFRRLDQLREAARRIGEGEFAVSLPETRTDEIGQLFSETNRTASALADREAAVESEWARLNDTITERTEELRRANESLARTDENRRRFFADIGHELRTPLTVILMEAQLGRTGSGSAADSFETIENRALRLNRRIDDMLRIARSESGRLKLGSEPFDLPETARQSITECEAELNSAGMQIMCDPSRQIRVIGDRNWVRQIITGLIRNAIRHARSGGRVALTIDQSDTMGRVQIRDNGPGIDPADQQAVFERFRQGHAAGASEGFGIGLAFARWVAEEQGGSIFLTSPLPQQDRLGEAPGTKVTLCIPLDPN